MKIRLRLRAPSIQPSTRVLRARENVWPRGGVTPRQLSVVERRRVSSATALRPSARGRRWPLEAEDNVLALEVLAVAADGPGHLVRARVRVRVRVRVRIRVR